MSGNCKIDLSVKNTLLREGVIDANDNILDSIAFKRIKDINTHILNTYGSYGAENGIPVEYLGQNSAESFLNKRTPVTLSFNEAYGNHIEGVINRTNIVFEKIPNQMKANSLGNGVKSNATIEIKPVRFFDSPEITSSYNNGKIYISEGVRNSQVDEAILSGTIQAALDENIKANVEGVEDLKKLKKQAEMMSDNVRLFKNLSISDFANSALTDPDVIAQLNSIPSTGSLGGTSLLGEVLNSIQSVANVPSHLGISQISRRVLENHRLFNPEVPTFSSPVEQQHWDNITNTVVDRHIDDSDFSDGIQTSIDFGDTALNSPYLNSPTDDLNNSAGEQIEFNPDSFGDWIVTRSAILKRLNQLRDFYYKQDKFSPKLKDINSAIEEMEGQIEDINSDDPFTIFNSAMYESEILSSLMEEAKDNPERALEITEINDIEKRVKDLAEYFGNINAKTLENISGDYLKTPFYEDFEKYFGIFNKKGMKDLRDNINRLTVQYKNLRGTILKSAIVNDPLIKQHMASGTMTAKQLEDLVTKADNKEFEIDMMGSKALGIWNAGILGQTLASRKEAAVAKENAFIAKQLLQLRPLWDKIKDIKDGSGYLIDHLFQKDMFGIKMNKLASKYSDKFFNSVKDTYAERNTFQISRTPRDYKSWMEAEKENFHRIDVRMFTEVYNKYANDEKYSKYFEGIDDTARQEYQDKLRQQLGPIMYDIEVKKATESIDEYVHSVENMMLTPRQKVVKNPFAFLQHHNSDNFASKSISEGVYLEPSYTRYIPNFEREEFYSNDFSSVENNEDLANYYRGFHELLTDYINPTLQSEGINVGGLDIESFENPLERTTVRTLSTVGKISNAVKAIWNDNWAKYSDGTLASMDDRLENPKHDRQKLVIAYSGEVRNRLKKLKDIYSKMSDVALTLKAREVGLTIPEGTVLETDKGVKTPLFYHLAESVARAQLNRVTSTNLQESINNTAYMVADVRARRSVVGFLEVLKDISQSANIRKGESTETKTNTNINKFLQTWGQANIYGEKFAQDMDNKGEAIYTKIAKFKMFGLKTYSEADRLAMKKIDEAVKHMDLGNLTSFTYKDNSYEVSQFKGQTTIKKNGQEISFKEASNAYSKMLTESLGTKVTLGSIALGLMNNVRFVQLAFSPRAGVKNRLAGMSQTLSVAASHRFGFDMNELMSARRMLRGMNTVQYASKLGWKIDESNPRYKQVNMLETLVSNLELQQNRNDEMALGARFESNKLASGVQKLNDFLMDFAMNNPERHNQLEIVAAVMMTTKVTDTEGNQHNLLDSSKLGFNIYKEGTLELKENFRTPENEAMWENFESFTGEDGTYKNDSVAMTTRIRSAIEQTQGNYNNADIIPIQSSVVGKTMTMYTRYLYENVNLQYGKHYFDVRTGEFNIKGRKINMAEHAPTLTAYLMSNTALPIMAGSIAFIASSPLIAATAGIATAASIGLLIKQKSLNLQSLAHAKEWSLAKDFALETLMRMGKTPLATFSYGAVKTTGLDTKISNLQSKTYDGMLTPKERMMLSECAQEIATKFMMYSSFTLAALAAKFLFSALTGGDDEDENYVQEKLKDLVNIENVANSLLNDRNQVMSDFNRYTDPKAFYNDATAFAFWRSLNRDFSTVGKVIEGKYEDDEAQMLYDVSKISFIPGVNLIPNNAKKAIYGMYNKDAGIFADNRVYEGKDQLDKYIAKESKKGEDYYKAEASELRDALRSRAKKFFESQVKSENLELKRDEREEEVKRRVNQFLKATNKRHGTYEQLISTGIFEAKKEELKNLENRE